MTALIWSLVSCDPPRADFAPLGGRRQLELKLLRVAQGDVGHRIAGRRDLVLHQADDRELVAARAERHLLAEGEAGAAIDDHFIMAAQDLAPGDNLARSAGPARLEADEEEALAAPHSPRSAPIDR